MVNQTTKSLLSTGLITVAMTLLPVQKIAAAPVVLQSGFQVDVFASGYANMQSLAVDANGDVYVGIGGNNGSILRFDDAGNSQGVFATGIDNPMGMVWGSGDFGNSLYISDGVGAASGPARVAVVGQGGGVAATYWQTNNPGETWPFDLDIDESGAYGNDMIVVDSGGPDSLLQVDENANRTVLTFVPENLAGLEFSHAGSSFSSGLYTFHQGSALVNHYAPNGSQSVIASVTSGLADGRFGLPGSGFGDLLYLSDNVHDSIFTLDSSGNINTFATGFNFVPNWISGSMVFNGSGDTLYVIDDGNNQVIRIQANAVPSPASIVLLCLGVVGLMLGRRR